MMKKLAILITLGVAFSCQQPTEQKSKIAEEPMKDAPVRDPLTGAWSMTNLYTVDNSTGDTVMMDRKQFKLYVDGNVMWGQETQTDSTEWFGYGTYEMDGDTLRETMYSGSNQFRKILSESGNQFSMNLIIFEDSYTQIQRNSDVTVYEVYDRID